MKTSALIMCLVGVLCFGSFAQSNTQLPAKQDYQISWEKNQLRSGLAEDKVECPYFPGAVYDFEEGTLPWFHLSEDLSGNPERVGYELVNPIFEAVPVSALKPFGDELNLETEVKAETDLAYYQKKPVGIVRLLPFRKNPSSGQIERLVSFDIRIRGVGVKKEKRSSRYYASKSVLSSGDWYKVTVDQDAIYKVSFEDLKRKGMPVESLPSDQIRLFGNGGGMLPVNNAAYRHDDLVENAISVNDGGDGTFDAGDYFLFYGQGPHRWNENGGLFRLAFNIYSDSTYYFLTFDQVGTPKRIETQGSEPSFDVAINSFSGRVYYQRDLHNLIKSGRQWYGDQYNSIQPTYEYRFNVPNAITSVPGKIRYSVAARSIGSSSLFEVEVGGSIFQESISGTVASYESTYAYTASGTQEFLPPSGSFDVRVSHLAGDNTNAVGWLNYLELNVRRELKMVDDQMFFRDAGSFDADGSVVGGFTLTGAQPDLTVWDVSDPVNVKEQAGDISNGVLTFNRPTNIMAEYAAFAPSNYATPSIRGKVPNQNLHGYSQTDLIIVSHSKFLPQAEGLATLHRQEDDMKVVVVTTDQVYNEFSSGAQDITAIKDFTRMFYDRAGSDISNFPKYLLLYGDASFDYKERVGGNTNFVPTYQSGSSLSPIGSYASDDYFGLLDEDEGESTKDIVDIGIGRLMVKNTREAQGLLEKIQHYYKDQTLGPWRNTLAFVADDEENWGSQPYIHMEQADSLAKALRLKYPQLNIDKIMFDAYQQVAGAGGARYPDVNEAIKRRMSLGSLIMSYTGHGGEAGWAHERVLGVAEINAWDNLDNMPLLLTATCEFSRYDDPLRTSGGELALLNPSGGAIGLMTTTRLVTAWDNFSLATAFFNHAYEPVNGEMPRLGDIYRLTKKDSPKETNSRKFNLLGDPALRLAYPKHQIETTEFPDTLKALDKVTVKGFVADKNGLKLDWFNGVIFPLVFDQSSKVITLDNEGWGPWDFELQNNVIFRGKASVKNGEFEFSFVVPKDLSPTPGKGKLSYYAHNGKLDASGAYEDFIIGGPSGTLSNDDQGPVARLFLNDTNFSFGGLTDEDPLLLAYLFDDIGINTSSAGIGHDLVATLDENTADAIVLNDYYESELDSYQRGSIRYPLSELSEGRHSLKIKVWDVNNNSSETYTEFLVASGANLALEHVLNYPNPFTTHTDFYFNHNQPGQDLSVRIQIFTVSGRVIKTLDGQFSSEGFRAGPVAWDGRDEYGDKIGRGVYVYKLKVTAPTGESVDEFQKLVILN